MEENFEEILYTEISPRDISGSGNVIKSENVNLTGKSKISIEQNSEDGVKIVLKKDDEENIKEIKFICSCGETKSILLDYSDQ
ncbi:MAG: hypothetical protein K9J16_02355 [Melioribacteraceae bacterium]|nr:hypothetical protein [Melioribacteraceae bacterium]MCF8353740.1 hypothetical protein [Melioribacteraceae bacterium]MCF8392451.1 hypothetical protein [Melioribacteraceae bacterium]MCF8418362.1 hypothetical protein [Melioribacteraceae bacterium]